MVLKTFDEVIEGRKSFEERGCAIVAADKSSIVASLEAEEKGQQSRLLLETKGYSRILQSLDVKETYDVYDVDTLKLLIWQ